MSETNTFGPCSRLTVYYIFLSVGLASLGTVWEIGNPRYAWTELVMTRKQHNGTLGIVLRNTKEFGVFNCRNK